MTIDATTFVRISKPWRPRGYTFDVATIDACLCGWCPSSAGATDELADRWFTVAEEVTHATLMAGAVDGNEFEDGLAFSAFNCIGPVPLLRGLRARLIVGLEQAKDAALAADEIEQRTCPLDIAQRTIPAEPT